MLDNFKNSWSEGLQTVESLSKYDGDERDRKKTMCLNQVYQSIECQGANHAYFA